MSLLKTNLFIFAMCGFFYCFSQEKIPNIYPQVITCCSIVLGFAIASLTSFYNHREINMILKEEEQLDDFLNYNQRFIIGTIVVLILTLAANIMTWEPYKFQIRNIELYFHMKALVFVATMHMLYQASEYVIRMIKLYQNTYSEMAQSRLSRFKSKKNSKKE